MQVFFPHEEAPAPWPRALNQDSGEAVWLRVRKQVWQKEFEERVSCCIEMIEKTTSSLQSLILMPEIRIRVHVDHKPACCQALKPLLLLSASLALPPRPVFRASSVIRSQLEVTGRYEQAVKPLRPAPASCSLCRVMQKPARCISRRRAMRIRFLLSSSGK
ncbi:unnamed protein product [Symbiodinium sp. CCMP2456]|nr:unnamed protein product [Symbiodinium sp. CCMP2456]